MKERYGLTDMRKAANRMMFNQAEEEWVDGDDVRMGAAGQLCHTAFCVEQGCDEASCTVAWSSVRVRAAVL